MYDVNEKDWKILRKKVPVWQENYMEKLNIYRNTTKRTPCFTKFLGFRKKDL